MAVHLKLLMPDGSFYEHKYDQDTSVEHITGSLFRDWPDNLGKRPKSNHLKLIFQGRFLSGNLKLSELKLPSEPITMHLVQHETMPMPRINEKHYPSVHIGYRKRTYPVNRQ
ncbi:Ubiquitin-like protein 3 [Schistosoma japonicum]|nr:Ubiquitin-like protein 3 [Schistosoma japonicum]